MFFNRKHLKTLAISCIFLLASLSASATIVEVRTNVGNFQVNLFDQTTPQTVANFLSYVNSGAYANNVVHRRAQGFVIQMGGFQFNDAFPPDPIATAPAVVNEPELSNVRGTLSMAKLGGDPNSATSQFFVNLNDNSANLDVQNGGFTVFGQVIDDGMLIVDQIAGLPTGNFGGAFTDFPLQNYTASDAQNNVEITRDNVVLITDIVVIDSTVVTGAGLNPRPNTLIDQATGDPSDGIGGSSGGSLGFGLFIMLFGVLFIRKRNN